MQTDTLIYNVHPWLAPIIDNTLVQRRHYYDNLCNEAWCGFPLSMGLVADLVSWITGHHSFWIFPKIYFTAVDLRQFLLCLEELHECYVELPIIIKVWIYNICFWSQTKKLWSLLGKVLVNLLRQNISYIYIYIYIWTFQIKNFKSKILVLDCINENLSSKWSRISLLRIFIALICQVNYNFLF